MAMAVEVAFGCRHTPDGHTVRRQPIGDSRQGAGDNAPAKAVVYAILANSLRVIPALLLAFLVCGCARLLIDNETQARVDYEAAYSLCKSATKTDMRACDLVMKTDSRSNNSSGYLEIGLSSDTTDRRTVNSR
jgi:hypothetical protein